MNIYPFEKRRLALELAKEFEKFVSCPAAKCVKHFCERKGIGRTKFRNLMRWVENERKDFNYDKLIAELKSRGRYYS